MAYIKGTTPTIIFTSPDTFDCTLPSKIVLTVKSGAKVIIRKENEDLDIQEHSISVWFSQEETLSFQREIKMQLNMLYDDGNRAASDEKRFEWKDNQLNEVMT